MVSLTTTISRQPGIEVAGLVVTTSIATASEKEVLAGSGGNLWHGDLGGHT